MKKRANKDKLNYFTSTNFSCMTVLYTLRMTMGVIEDNGLLSGLMKLLGEGGRLSGDTSVGVEKSPISLLSTIPVKGERTPAPNA